MWVGDIEGDGLIEELTKLHCFVTKKYKKDQWVIACDKSQLPTEFVEDLESKYKIHWMGFEGINQFLYKCGAFVVHNLYGYDLKALKKLGYIKDYDISPEHIDGHEVRLIDSLSMSRCLMPDRPLPAGCPAKVYNPVNKKFDNVGPHGLMAWGYRVANAKPEVHDWRNQPLDVYIHRCVEDVIINELTLEALIKESQKLAMGDNEPFLGRKGDWKVPLRINSKMDFTMELQESDGILFDRERAIELSVTIDEMMKDIEEDVEPQLPRRDLPKSKRPTFPSKPFTDSGDISGNGWSWIKNKLNYPVDEEVLKFQAPPKTAFKKDGELSKAGLNYCDKMEFSGSDQEKKDFIRSQLKLAARSPLPDDLMSQALEDLHNKVMPDMTEPMRLSNQADIKQYLVEQEGWQPTIWRTKDVSRDGNKQNHPEEVVLQKVKDYIEDVKESPYLEFICEEMEVNFRNTLTKKQMDKLVRQARYLVTSPKLKDERGELCPSLAMLKGDMAKQIVKWLSLRNRRSVLKALDEKKETGWLNNPRLDIDGRLGQGHSGPTNTNRYKHRTIVNLPKAAPDVLLGHEFRSLFIAPPKKKILGYDGSNLEQFVAASYAYQYDNGDYAAQLKGDAHTTNAIAYSKAAEREVTRSEGKNITYAVLYGAQKAKIAKMLGISLKAAQKVIDAFWDTNYGLKALKENLEKYWEATGNRYIRGVDGRKIYTRSRHSLVNALFQSCGSLIMFVSGCFMYDMLKERGLIEKGVVRLAFVHDEFQYEVPEELIEVFTFDTKEEAEAYDDGRYLSNVREVDGKFERCYSIVGDLGNQSLMKAGKYFRMPLPFNAAYDVGNNLAETH